MNAKILIPTVFLINYFRFCQLKSYKNYTLFNAFPLAKEHFDFLQNLEHNKYIDVVFWKKPYKLFESVQFIVNPVDKELFLERASHYKLNTTVLIEDVQRAFDDQVITKYYRLSTDTFSWDKYHSLEDVYQWLSDMAMAHPKAIALNSIGKSAEGRDIYVVHVKKKKNTRFKIVIEGGMHGNEWITTEFVTYLLDQLIRPNGTYHGVLAKLLKKYEWFLIPIMNPDGYAYSQTTDRLWRKNRRVVRGTMGVDMNRNFDYSFGRFGTMLEKDQFYSGPHPFSEPETRALNDFLTKIQKGLRYYVSYHAYGEKIVIPFGDRIKHLDNYGEAENFGKQAIMKMYRVNGRKYSVGTFFDTLGVRISGDSASYVKKTFNVRFVFTFLLRDNGTYGFALPPKEILPACEEALVGLTELMVAKHRQVKLEFRSGSQIIRPSLIIFSFVFILL